jgi:transposase
MIPADVRIFLCTEPVDMRKSFDGLTGAAREHLQRDPDRGGLFVFVNRRSNRLKVLWLDGLGYCLLYKRLHRALFRLPDLGGRARLDGAQLAQLLAGVPTRRAREQDRSPRM